MRHAQAMWQLRIPHAEIGGCVANNKEVKLVFLSANFLSFLLKEGSETCPVHVSFGILRSDWWICGK
jgi:hypothetical protein